MINEATINNSGAVLEIKNVPTELILYAIQQWSYNGQYSKKVGSGKNTNYFIRAISVWLILKNETTTGTIKNYRRQLDDLAAKCKMSARTLDKYLDWLEREKLVHTEGKNLLMHNYQQLKINYGISIRKRELQSIEYDTTDDKSLAEKIIALGIERMQERRMEVYWNKLTQNSDMYKTLYDFLVFIGADANRLQDREYFRQCHLEAMLQAYEEEKPGQPAYDLLHTTIKANPDLNCKAATYGRKMGYSVVEKANPVTKKDESESMGFSHLKNRLAKKGLIEVASGHVESDCRSRKDEKVFHHRYVRETKITIWYRCDQVTVKTATIFGQKMAS